MPLASVCILARTSSCCDETSRSADDTSVNARFVFALDGIVCAVTTSVDYTSTVGLTDPLGPRAPDCCVGNGVKALGNCGTSVGICCVGLCLFAGYDRAIGALTLPCTLIPSSLTILMVRIPLLYFVHTMLTTTKYEITLHNFAFRHRRNSSCELKTHT